MATLRLQRFARFERDRMCVGALRDWPHLFFPGGERAHVFVSWLHPFKEQKLVVIVSEAMAVPHLVTPVQHRVGQFLNA